MPRSLAMQWIGTRFTSEIVSPEGAARLRAEGWIVMTDPQDEAREAQRSAEIEAVRQEDERRGPLPRHWWGV